MKAVTALVIPIAISAHHVHLSQQTIAQLFGSHHQLTPSRPLVQPGQFSACETVNLVGPRGRLDHVRVVGPPRPSDQVEISLSDARALGLTVPVRLSGDLDASAGVILEGPSGTVSLRAGVVCALRHIHMSPEDAARLDVRDRQKVAVAIENGSRRVIFEDVVVRASPDYRLELHLDTDEGNAAGVGPQTVAYIVRTAM